MIDAIKRVAASGKPVTREAVRDAIQTAKVPTMQGVVSFDENGDLEDRTVSVFQIKQDKNARVRTTVAADTTTSAWRRSPEQSLSAGDDAPFDLLLQQTINGLSLGAMYSLLALGFTLVYGILELINFSHFNVFMVGSFIALFVLQAFGLSGQEVILTGLPLVGVLLAAFLVTMVFCGGLGVADRADHPASAAQRQGTGRDDHLDRRLLHPVQRHPADRRRGFEELPQPAAVDPLADRRRHPGLPRRADLGDRAAADGRSCTCSCSGPASARRCAPPRRTPKPRA